MAVEEAVRFKQRAIFRIKGSPCMTTGQARANRYGAFVWWRNICRAERAAPPSQGGRRCATGALGDPRPGGGGGGGGPPPHPTKVSKAERQGGIYDVRIVGCARENRLCWIRERWALFSLLALKFSAIKNVTCDDRGQE